MVVYKTKVDLIFNILIIIIENLKLINKITIVKI